MAQPLQNVGRPGDIATFVTLDNVIGTPGEQGEAWLAHSTNRPELQYAVKICRTPSNTQGTSANDFQTECVVLAQMHHPNIVQIMDSGTALIREKDPVSFPFYTMEYLGRGVVTLKKALTDGGLSEAKKAALILRTLRDAAAALKHVHEKNYSHGDVKESNILISDSESSKPQIKLIDFGFSRHLVPAETSEESDLFQPQKRTSIRRSRDCLTRSHLDIYQLCHMIRRSLDLCRVPRNVGRDQATDWPIDYAAFPHLNALIDEWASEKPGSKPETAQTEDFYAELATLFPSFDLQPDVKGAIRYLSIEEISTAAQILQAFEAIRIPPRQLVLYTERVKALMTTPQFGALRYVRQLGFTHLVYPGAQGTRFEHSLGMYDLACQVVIRMSGHEAFRKICDSEQFVLKFILAALLHDVGHFPFAHQLEEFRADDFEGDDRARVENLIQGHHHRGNTIISELSDLMRKLFSLTPSDVADIQWLIFGDATPQTNDPTRGEGKEEGEPDGLPKAPALDFLHSLLDGPIDIDKLDYIERDAYHCGVPYGSYLDISRIRETMRVLEENGQPILAFDSRVVGSLEQFATARHELYANVYWHRGVRSASVMFKHAFYLFQQLVEEQAQIEDVFYNTISDDCVLYKMQVATDRILAKRAHEDGIKNKGRAVLRLLRAVSGTERVLYKVVLEKNRDHGDADRSFGGQHYGSQRQKARELFKRLETGGYLDESALHFGEHNILIDCYTDPFPNFESIRILPGGETKARTLGEVAPSVEQLKQNFRKQACKIRVFMNPEALKPEYRHKVGRLDVGKYLLQRCGLQ